MKWLLVLLLLSSALASEECVAQLGGKCRTGCEPTEKSEPGAFVDCSEKEKCCVAGPAPKASLASLPVVLIEEMAFSPAVMKVKAGTEVEWRNRDSSTHTVTAQDGSFASPPMDLDGVFRKKFSKPGTYSYTCEMHPFMSGKIVVE